MNASHQTPGAIAGQVVSAQGQPLSNAVIMITGDSPAHRDIAALTDASGQYRFDDLVPGHYTLLVNAEGYAAQTGQIQVEAGHVSNLGFTL